MKKVFTVLTAVLLLAVMVLSLASCAKKPSGKYGSDLLKTYFEFSGSKVTVTVLGQTSDPVDYTIDDDGNIKIVWEDDDNKLNVPSGLRYDAENDVVKSAIGDLKKMK